MLVFESPVWSQLWPVWGVCAVVEYVWVTAGVGGLEDDGCGCSGCGAWE